MAVDMERETARCSIPFGPACGTNVRALCSMPKHHYRFRVRSSLAVGTEGVVQKMQISLFFRAWSS